MHNYSTYENEFDLHMNELSDMKGWAPRVNETCKAQGNSEMASSRAITFEGSTVNFSQFTIIKQYMYIGSLLYNYL